MLSCAFNNPEIPSFGMLEVIQLFKRIRRSEPSYYWMVNIIKPVDSV